MKKLFGVLCLLLLIPQVSMAAEVGIIDSGVNFDHDHFAGVDHTWEDFVNNSNSFTSTYYHGTAVASAVLQGDKDDAISTLHIAKIYNDIPSLTLDGQYQGKDYMLDVSPDVVIIPQTEGNRERVKKLYNDGVLVVSPAGNDVRVRRGTYPEALGVATIRDGGYSNGRDADTGLPDGMDVACHVDNSATTARTGSSLTSAKAAGMAASIIKEARDNGMCPDPDQMIDAMSMYELDRDEATNNLVNMQDDCGDVLGNGEVETSDAIEVLRDVAGKEELNIFQEARVPGGEASVDGAIQILRQVVDLE